MKPNYGMGGGIASLLSPLTNMITQQLTKQSQASFLDKLVPYVNEVEDLTTETFPELDMSSTGGGIGNFPSPSINAPLFKPSTPRFGVPAGAFDNKPTYDGTQNDFSALGFETLNYPDQQKPQMAEMPFRQFFSQGLNTLYGYK